MVKAATLAGRELYNTLYEHGYHTDLKSWRGEFLMFTACEMSLWYNLSSFLDIGCSHGLGVQRLWEQGALTASGVDVSDKAVARARGARLRCPPQANQSTNDAACGFHASDKLRNANIAQTLSHRNATSRPPWPLLTGRSRCVPPCFQRAPATALPFADGSFDAVMSTDVLEHLAESEVDAAVGELTRVAKRFLFLKISNRKEHWPAKVPGANLPAALHQTVRPRAFWVDRFAGAGFTLHHALEDSRAYRWMRRFPKMCCSLVLQRRGEARLPKGIGEERLAFLRGLYWPGGGSAGGAGGAGG